MKFLTIVGIFCFLPQAHGNEWRHVNLRSSIGTQISIDYTITERRDGSYFTDAAWINVTYDAEECNNNRPEIILTRPWAEIYTARLQQSSPWSCRFTGELPRLAIYSPRCIRSNCGVFDGSYHLAVRWDDISVDRSGRSDKIWTERLERPQGDESSGFFEVKLHR